MVVDRDLNLHISIQELCPILSNLQSLRGRIAALASESSNAAIEAEAMVLRPMVAGLNSREGYK